MTRRPEAADSQVTCTVLQFVIQTVQAAQCAPLCSQNCESHGLDFSFARAFDPFSSTLGVATHSVEKSPHHGSEGHVVCLRDLS